MVFDGLEARLASQAVLITGGSSGIGLAAARLLRRAGATVGVLSHDADQLARMGEGFATYHADIREPASVAAAVDAFAARAGRIDALVHCAGVSHWKSLLEMDEAFWLRTHDTNVKGTFLTCQAVARHMIPRGQGLMVLVASMSALKSGMPAASAYASSKWAVRGLARNLHLELKGHGIRVGCFCPGSTRTDIHVAAGTADLEKMLDPDEVALALLFMLAAPDTGHVQLLAMPAMFEEWR